MAEGPTAFNGPLHADEASLGDRRIVAYFATREAASATRDALLAANVPAGQIVVTDAAVERSDLEPADDSIIGRVREAILPDDGQTATRSAIANGDTMLAVVPGADNVDQIVDIIQAGKPHHFDAGLERWRNSQPAT